MTIKEAVGRDVQVTMNMLMREIRAQEREQEEVEYYERYSE